MIAATLILLASTGADWDRFEFIGQNLVGNGGFERYGSGGLPAEWNGPPSVYSRTTAARHKGRASLAFVNPDAADYALCSQTIPLEPGRLYAFGCMVKATGVEGADSGATICVEWWDEDGEYLYGSYPRGVKGDTAWQEIKDLIGRAPASAHRASVTCYVRKGMTGVAHWDEVWVRRIRENPLSTLLLVPNYRGRVTDAGPAKALIVADVDLSDCPIGLPGATLTWQLIGEDARTPLMEGALDPVEQHENRLEIPVTSLEPGRYRVELSVVCKATGETLGESVEGIHRLEGTPRFTATFDAHNRFILDGKPFFPLGMYWGSVEPEQLDVFADSAFNCLMPYAAPDMATMDAIHERGLKVIYSVKDTYFGSSYCPEAIRSVDGEEAYVRERIEKFRGHPALIAWYINDELGLDWLPRVKAHYRWVEELDPHHPSWAVLYQVDQIPHHVPTFDVIGTDPYPINRQPASLAGRWTRQTVAAVHGSRPVWQVPQAHNWAIYTKQPDEKELRRPPTYREMRSMAWQCIAEGANGLIFYSWFDLHRDPAQPFEERWADVKRVAAEIGRCAPVLLSLDATPKVELSAEAGIHTVMKSYKGSTYVFVVSGSDEAARCNMLFPAKPGRVVEVTAGREFKPPPGNRLSLRVEPLDVRIFRIVGLPMR